MTVQQLKYILIAGAMLKNSDGVPELQILICYNRPEAAVAPSDVWLQGGRNRRRLRKGKESHILFHKRRNLF